jgi:hypothetical protein
VTVTEIKTEQIRIGALVERPIVTARATRRIFASTASTAAPPVSYGSYRNATDCGVLPI